MKYLLQKQEKNLQHNLKNRHTPKETFLIKALFSYFSEPKNAYTEKEGLT